MKKILFAFLLICSFWNYGIGQIQYTGCNAAINAGYPITLNLAGNDGTRNFYVNTLPGTPCSAGTCAFRVIWAGSQWEIQLSTNGGASYPNILYINTTASLPDPPDLSLGTWVGQGPCAGQALTTWTGNVQSTASTCSDPTVPTITSNPTSICAGSSTTLTISGTLNDATNWHIYTGSCGGTQIGMTSTNSFVVSPSVTTTYFVRGEDGAGCVDEATGACGSVMVTVNAIPSTPTISAGGATTFCTGGSVMLTSSASTGNQWMLNGNPIGGATSQSYSASTGGNYTVMSTVNNCASAASSATSVTVNAIPSTPTISAGGATTFCTGGSVTLTSSASTGNQWMLNGNPIGGATNQTYSATTGGSYTVMSTVNNCASTASSATSVTVNAIPNSGISTPSTTTICNGTPVTLTSVLLTGNQWFLNGNAIGGATGQTYSAAIGGNYTVTSTVNGCTSAASGIITITEVTIQPIISASSISICTGDTATLTSNIASGIQWFFNGNLILGATNQTLDVTTSGIYTLEATSGSCTAASNLITIVVNPNPITPSIVAGSSTTFCAGDSVIFNTTASTGNQWLLNGSAIGGATNQTLAATTAGNYSVEFTVNGCSSTSAIMAVTVNNAVTNTQTLVECAGSTVVIGSNVYTTGGTYTDTLTAANGCDSILTTNLTILAALGSTINQTVCAGGSITIGGITYDSTGVATQTYTSTGSGCDSVVTINLVVLNPIDTTITATLPTLTANTSVASYQWVNCDSSYAPLAGATGQAYTPTANGNYAVILTDGNCSDTSSCYAVIVTGIKHNKLTKMLTLFPNPTSGNLSIELGQIFEEVTIRVINVAGQQLSTKSFESTDKIDFNIEGAPGVYLLEVTTNEGDTTTIKVLKK